MHSMQAKGKMPTQVCDHFATREKKEENMPASAGKARNEMRRAHVNNGDPILSARTSWELAPAFYTRTTSVLPSTKMRAETPGK
jgi:hypothetical protein